MCSIRVGSIRASPALAHFQSKGQSITLATRMATFGRLSEFDADSEEWQHYEERMGHYFAANKIVHEERKRAIFLSSMGSRAYTLLRSLVHPAKPGEKSFKDLCTVLTDHFHRKPSATVQRFKFHSRVRHPGESVPAFVAALRRLAEHCNFGDSLNDMLRDRLVVGIQDERIQRRLLSDGDVEFQKAFAVSQAMELAAKNAEHLQQQGSINPSIHESSSSAVKEPKSLPEQIVQVVKGQKSIPCYRCGNSGHSPAKCRFKTTTCHKCKKVCHIARACKTKGLQSPFHRATFLVSQDDSSEDEDPEAAIQYVTETEEVLHTLATKEKPWISRLKVEGKSLDMELDTGASVSLISEVTYKELWMKQRPLLRPTTIVLKTYTGEKIPLLGRIVVHVSTSQARKGLQLPLLVVKGNGPSLCGRDWLDKLKLDWKSVHQVRRVETKDLESILEQYQVVFNDELGCLRETKVKIHVDPQVTPKFYRARSVPYALREKVEEALNKLEGMV